ncbi:hypothetical protein CSKR_204024 [Clonorchis sinensis]|uniref:Protein phosphatase 1 regulatory subunit 36 n=2 Tax=Clonorchis sinensis TaxID=79923 RepID=A0A8T1MUP8_CLOSI|nr:hypothetical protein CSKR_204024 [Clonorchis sinensis]
MLPKEELDNFVFSAPKMRAFEWNDETNDIDIIELVTPVKLAPVGTKPKPIKWNVHKQRLRVTMEDVKLVTIIRLKNSGLPITISRRFRRLVNTPEMDKLVLSLARYFDAYFESMRYEETVAESLFLPTSNQMIKIKQMKQQVNVWLVGAAEAYANLLMIAHTDYFEQQQKKRNARYPIDPDKEKQREHELFETIYWYLVFCVWVIMNRKRFETICSEVGWFIRSEMFNSLGRVGPEQLVRRSSRIELVQEIYERDLPRARMISQHSPALRILRHHPRDQSAYLFGNVGTNNTDKRIARILVDAKLLNHRDIESDSVGILGKPRSDYDEMLIPEEETENKKC